ncbi:pathogenesis-related protein [Gorgonomyces haynaldii]|nr:pathogenesis-related protein [Gorgonomyces haynaldii]
MAGGDQGCLSAHNAIRGFLGLSGLSWDGNLAAAAYKNSQYLASIGKLRHTSAGENLASGVGSCAGAVGLWQQERPNYYGQPIGSDGRLEFYGHYTQVIWPDARRVGCGIYRGYVTCRYDSGNESGVRLYKY